MGPQPRGFWGDNEIPKCVQIIPRMGNDSSGVAVIIYVTLPWENVNGRALNFSC